MRRAHGARTPSSKRSVKDAVTKELETVTHQLGLTLHVVHASNERELDDAFATLASPRAISSLRAIFWCLVLWSAPKGRCRPRTRHVEARAASAYDFVAILRLFLSLARASADERRSRLY